MSLCCRSQRDWLFPLQPAFIKGSEHKTLLYKTPDSCVCTETEKVLQHNSRKRRRARRLISARTQFDAVSHKLVQHLPWNYLPKPLVFVAATWVQTCTQENINTWDERRRRTTVTTSCLWRQEVVRISLFPFIMSFFSTGRCSRLVGAERAVEAGWSDCARLTQHWSEMEAASAARAAGMLRAVMFIQQERGCWLTPVACSRKTERTEAEILWPGSQKHHVEHKCAVSRKTTLCFHENNSQQSHQRVGPRGKPMEGVALSWLWICKKQRWEVTELKYFVTVTVL